MNVYYQNNNVKLYCGDCLEIMPRIEEKANLVLTDPPYNMLVCKWDVLIPFSSLWQQLESITIYNNTPIILFASQPFTTDLINSNRKGFKYQLIWNKNVPTGMASAKYRPMKYHEQILVFNTDTKSTYNPIMKQRVGKHKECYRYNHYCGNSNHINVQKVKRKYDPQLVQPSSVLNFNVVPNRKGKLHPTQKPVELLKYLIQTYSNENDTVLDFAAGSGSLGEACFYTNRKAILIQKQEKYCEVIANRLDKLEKENLF